MYGTVINPHVIHGVLVMGEEEMGVLGTQHIVMIVINTILNVQIMFRVMGQSGCPKPIIALNHCFYQIPVNLKKVRVCV